MRISGKHVLTPRALASQLVTRQLALEAMVVLGMRLDQRRLFASQYRRPKR
jgi:hypothetical protein